MPNFSTATLASVQLKAESMWGDGQFKEDYVAEVEALRAFRERQTATISELEAVDKDYTVKVNWLDTSLVAASAATDNCVINVPEIDAKAKPYELTIHQEAGFKYSEDDLRRSIYSDEEVIARGMLRAMQVLDEKLAAVSVAKAVGYAGVNTFLGGNTYAAGVTTIPAASYNRTLFAYLVHAAKRNRMRNSYVVSNGDLFQEFLNASFDAGNNDGKGDVERFKALKVYHDLFNFEAAGTDADLLLVNNGALAFASQVKYSAAPKEYGGNVGQTRYSVESMNLPGVRYEVYYTMDCVGSKIWHSFKLQAHADLLLNPEGMTAGSTGVLAFAKGI